MLRWVSRCVSDLTPRGAWYNVHEALLCAVARECTVLGMSQSQARVDV